MLIEHCLFIINNNHTLLYAMGVLKPKFMHYLINKSVTNEVTLSACYLFTHCNLLSANNS